ncbi:MAG TPA: hypothetical protein VGC00_04140 [Thermoanaerobaculia bacterium]
MRKRHATALGVGAGALAAVVAHAIYWYVPRERPSAPSAAALARLGEPGWTVAAWVSYPHQNLACVGRRVGDLRRWLAMVLPPGRASADRLPHFGPWLVPPSRELVVAERGGELVVELDVYPTIGLVARASGRLARNPWLVGGEVALSGGRRASVSWEGRRWRLRTATTRVPEPSSSTAATSPALARLRLARDFAWLPAGEYRLERAEGSLELRSGEIAGLGAPPLGVREPRPAAWLVERGEHRAARALVIWEEEGSMPPFPAALTLERGGMGRLRLPGEELLRIAGGEPRRRRAAGFELRALAGAEIEAGTTLAAELAALLAERRGLQRYAGLRPDRVAAAARRLAASLRGLPLGQLLGVEPERLAAAVAPLAGCAASVLEVRRAPRGVRWRLCLDEAPAVPAR